MVRTYTILMASRRGVRQIEFALENPPVILDGEVFTLACQRQAKYPGAGKQG